MMTKAKKNIALLFMAIYSIVFVHNIIPHHHHSDETVPVVKTMCSSHSHDHLSHGHLHHDEFCDHQDEEHKGIVVDHHHPLDQHHACHFEVNPVVKSPGTTNFELAIVELDDVVVPLEEAITIAYTYCPQKLLASYNFAVPLRAPPYTV